MISHSRRSFVTARIVSRFTSPSDVWLAARVLGWACVLPALKHLMPMKSLVGMVGRRSRRHQREAGREERIVTFARWACRLTRWKEGGNCLERGLIVYRFLGEGGADPTLVVGMSRGHHGRITGHAWVLIDGRPVGESLASVSAYTPVFAFGQNGTLCRSFAPVDSTDRPSAPASSH